ncbi:MAG: alpha/beta hydrolase family protein [Promethearchaeota archaeon]
MKLFVLLIIVESVLFIVSVIMGFIFTLNYFILGLLHFMAFCIMAIILIILGFRSILGDWENLLDFEFLQYQKVLIPLKDGNELVAYLLSPGVEDHHERLPAVICHHGLAGNKKRLIQYAAPLAMKGYRVLLPDARAHGDSRKRFNARKDDWFIDENSGILPDVHGIVDYLVARPDIDENNIFMIGHSLGALACLTTGLKDERIKMVIAMSGCYSFNNLINAPPVKKIFSESWFQMKGISLLVNISKLKRIKDKISPSSYFKRFDREYLVRKIRLVHAKDDELVIFNNNAKKIHEELNLPSSHVFFPEKGGHTLRGQETTILTKILEWLDEGLTTNRNDNGDD